MTQWPTVILLHSSASSARQWDGLLQPLQSSFRVHAIDLLGHGQRPGWRTDEPLTLADDAALAARLLSADGAHLVGHSYGGAVALKLAAMYPRAVHSVAVYEPVLFRWLIGDDNVPPPTMADVIAVADSICERLWDSDEHGAAERFVDFWSGAGSWNLLPERTRGAIAARMRVVAQHFDALFHESLRPTQVAAVRAPMLFMTGTQTVAAMHSLGAQLRRAFPYAQHEMMAGMGHMGPITHASAVNRRLVDFLHVHAASNSVELLAEAA
jgi:pimeloyl-ACP methyl ester carboxylesterase